MENDVKKVSEKSPVDSSTQLTDWLLKYKLDYISYLSVPQSLPNQLPKTARRGNTFESRDIIRPTFQLFKNIKNKNKRRNDTPSPTRYKTKAYPSLSPTKENNRVFNHKTTSEGTLDSYRKIFTYAKVKQDKVSRDKIESAVALHRQREQEKENSSNRPAPEKEQHYVKIKARQSLLKKKKQVGSEELVNTTAKHKSRARTSKSEKKSTLKDKRHHKSKEKQDKKAQEIENSDISITRQLSLQKGDNNKEEDLEPVSLKKKLKRKKQSLITSDEKETNKNTGKDKSNKKIKKEETTTQNIIEAVDTKLKKPEKETLGSFQQLKRLNSDNKHERKQISVINYTTDRIVIEQPYKTQSRSILIKSLKSKYSRLETNKSNQNVLSSREIVPGDYIVIKPAIIDKGPISIQAGIKPKKSVDDLLREYRLKYRNMIKLR